MQTLARYFVALLLFLFSYATQDDPPKEKLVESCTQENVKHFYACELNFNKTENII